MKPHPQQFGAWPAEHEEMRPFIGGISIEIGCFQGWTSRFMSKHCAELVCIDPWDGTQDGSNDEVYARFLENTKDCPNITVIRARSQNADVEKYRGKVTCVFVDGLHTFGGCLTDIEKYSGLLNATGTIFIHDFFNAGWSGIKQAVDGFLAETGKSARFFAYYPTETERKEVGLDVCGLAYWTK